MTAIAWLAVAAIVYGACRAAAFFITDAFEDIEQ